MKIIAHVLANFVFVVLSFGFTFAQLTSQDPGHKEDAEVPGVKFSVPNKFNLEKSFDSNVAFMRHEKYGLALFVAVPEKQTDDEYLTKLSNTLVSLLYPDEKNFMWKILPVVSERRVSQYQTATGNTKGFNQKKCFQTDYKVLKVKDREIIVGYMMKLGQDKEAKFLYDLKGPGGLSMTGWYAQAHIIASITGEKYEEINRGTFIKGTPVKKN
jgi:hypothetical protein